MRNTMFKLAGVKNEKDFYAKFPTEEAFMAKHGKAFEKARYGIIAGTVSPMPLNFDTGYKKVAKSGIHIKPENKGKFNATKKATGKTTEELTHSSNPVTKKRAIFAQNASHWKKGAGGVEVDPITGQPIINQDILNPGGARVDLDEGVAPTGLQNTLSQRAQSLGLGTPRQLPSGFADQKLDFTGMPMGGGKGPGFLKAAGGFLGVQGPKVAGQVAGGLGKADNFLKDFDGAGKLGGVGGVAGVLSLGTDIAQGVSMIKEERKQKNNSHQLAALSDVVLDASSTRPDKPKRKYVRPEDNTFDPYQMSNTYGTGSNFLAAKNGGKIKKAQTGIKVAYSNPSASPAMLETMSKTLGINVQHDDTPTAYSEKKYGKRYAGYDYIDIDKNIPITKYPKNFQEEAASDFSNVPGMPNRYILKDYVKEEPPAKWQLISEHPHYASYKDQPKYKNEGVYANSPEQEHGGSTIPKAQFGQLTGSLGGMLGSKIFGGSGEQTGGSKIGGSVGSTVGSIFGPVGGAIGGFLGGAIGGAFGAKNQKETAEYDKTTNSNLYSAAFTQGARGIQDQYSSYVKHGGSIPTDMKGDLESMWGGGAEHVSTNPYLPGGGESIKFQGQSHADGGIGIKYGGSPVEVEGGEPAQKFNNGGDTNSLVVFGDMKIPSYGQTEINDPLAKGKKFKGYINELNKVEAKQNKKLDKGMTLVNEANPNDRFDLLKFNSGKALSYGADQKLKDIAQKKKMASIVQNAILDTANEHGIQSDALAEGKIKKAKKGAMIPYAQPGGQFDPETTKGQILDPIIPGRNYITKEQIQEYIDKGYHATDDPNRYVLDPKEGRHIPGKKGEKYVPVENDWWRSLTPEQKREHNFKTKARIASDPRYKDSPGIDEPGTPGDEVWLRGYKSSPVEKDPVTNPDPNVPGVGIGSFLNAYMPMLRPTTKLKLDPNQLAGEMYSLATNNLEPVQSQLYHPLLDNVSDVSYQDQMNENQADFRSIATQVQNNPSALATLAAQKYDANSKVLGQQFRDNQGARMEVYNKNRATLNDATLKNLAILDTQYVRQSTAKSNTKAITQAALSSIADKIGQNKRDQRLLNIDEQRYNYRFGPNGMAWNWNGPAQFNMNGNSNVSKIQYLDDKGNIIKTEERNTTYDKNNIPIKTEDKDKTVTKSKNGGLVKAFKY